MPVGRHTYFTAWVISTLFAVVVYLAENSISAKFIAAILALTGLYIGAKLIPRGRVNPQGRAVFITGCDTGFGNKLARRLDDFGFTVFAGCYVPDGLDAKTLSEETSARLTVIPCDVTSNESVKTAQQTVEKALQRHGLRMWAVVNNAGIWCWGQVEWTTIEQYKRVAEVNLYGTIRVTQAFLPLIRTTKGRIVNIGSISGLWSVPYISPYCVTKYAIECLSDALRLEMSPWGVKVVLVEPGEYGKLTKIALHSRTSLHGVSDPLWNGMNAEVRTHYGREYFDAHIESLHRARDACWDDLTPVIDAMFDSVVSHRPKHRYLVGELSTYYTRYKFTILPTWITDRVFTKELAGFPKPAALKEKSD